MSQLVEIVDSFGRIRKQSTAMDLWNIGEDFSVERFVLLLWLNEQFSGQIISVGEKDKIGQMPQRTKQFLRIVTHPGPPKRNLTGRKAPELSAGFYGTTPSFILGLLELGPNGGPNAQNMRITSHPEHALRYMNGWKRSHFKNVVVLLGVEVNHPIQWRPSQKSPNWGYTNCWLEDITICHVFVFSDQDVDLRPQSHIRSDRCALGLKIPNSQGILKQMADVYKELHQPPDIEMSEADQTQKKRQRQS
ncbi:hypothetical protein GGR57DRAFT_508305 [Xylariaceae sp. FL1272]|nr:hypothetical protein GGR57DRAFT_508305 [Xylariaceae sp. FL1272]